MTETIGPEVEMPTGTAAPAAADDGVDISDRRAWLRGRLLLTVVVGGTGSCELEIHGKSVNGRWGVCGERNGKVNEGAVLSAGSTYHFVIANHGAMTRLYGRRVNVTSSPTITAYLAEYGATG